MQFEITQWIEDLISMRDSYRAEAEATGRENMRIKEQLAKDFAEIAAQLAAKDAEIARLTALLKEAEAVKIVQETVDSAIEHANNPLAAIGRIAEALGRTMQEAGDSLVDNACPQPAQEQADEHPAKKGWINPGANDERWSPTELNEGPWAWEPAEDYWVDHGPEIIAAYDRYMQEGGQAQ